MPLAALAPAPIIPPAAPPRAPEAQTEVFQAKVFQLD
jgi:hypothetical protein